MIQPNTGIGVPPHMRTQYYQIPNGVAGTAATIEAMRAKALECAHRHERTLQLARWIVEDVPAKDYVGEARAIFRWVKDHIRYTLDPAGLEHVSGPCASIFVTGAGDCDDMATAIAALALAAGHEAAFRTVAADPGRPSQFSHVYALIGVRLNGQLQWYAADATQAQAYLGWEPPGTWGKRDWPVRL